jgi:hypothetical protein
MLGYCILKNLVLGSLTKQAEIFRLKEERKIIAGFTSGRRAPEAVEVLYTVDTPCIIHRYMHAYNMTLTFIEISITVVL